MKDHQLVEHGSHDERLAKGGVYSGLYNIQHDPRMRVAASWRGAAIILILSSAGS